MLGENNFLDSIMEALMNGILGAFKMIFSVVFFSNWSALIFWIVVSIYFKIKDNYKIKITA